MESTHQLNTGENTDFLNILNRNRLDSKKEPKTKAVQPVLKARLESENIHRRPERLHSLKER